MATRAIHGLRAVPTRRQARSDERPAPTENAPQQLGRVLVALAVAALILLAFLIARAASLTELSELDLGALLPGEEVVPWVSSFR